MFQPVNSRVNFAQLEEEILEGWRKGDIFRKSVAAREGGPRFTLYEGPPTANGSPGIHHVLARVFKDVIPRYKVMKGYYAPRIAGWDTHGLPVELEVEKELGLSSKAGIEQYGIERFNALCRDSVFRYLKDWNSLTERIAFWVDLEHPYITMENSYIESVWWAIKQMWEKGLVYQGYKTAAHCPRCGTSLSSHEVALGYREDTEDPSIYIKFKAVPSSLSGVKELAALAAEKPVYFLAWTTTPWTLPGNTALAVNADAEYAVVANGDGYLVLASARLSAADLAGAPVAAKVEGRELVKARYEPLYNPHRFGAERLLFKRLGSPEMESQGPEQDLTYPVIATDFVSLDDGTGIVHVAPAFGEVDFESGMQQGLDFVQPVDLQGIITGSYPFSGEFVKNADEEVMRDLKDRGLLFHRETIRHTYPFCWRCGTPLLYYVKQTWYIRTTARKEAMIAGNNEINWYPEHIKHGRFGDWLENNVDWAFSRERYWGTPLPVWRCETCGNFECIGGLAELEGKPGLSGFTPSLDLHRPFVDEVTYECEGCRGRMKRLPEVIDCWFDSGAMPIAQSHYPFENETLLEDGRFPADYICEAVDQTRGWFYSLHAISTLLFDRSCYRNVICLGHILDAAGEKMSKTRGNVVEPWAVINKYGADALRWYLFTATPPGNVHRFDEKTVAETSRRVFSTLWNVYSFFVTYANIDKYVPQEGRKASPESELDRWLLSELNQLVQEVDTALENYSPTEAGRKIESFIDYLSNWYVRRSRRRFWKSESDADKQSAYDTLYHSLVTLAKLLAPLAPFLAEAMYRNLVLSALPGAEESVHLADFPAADESLIDRELSDNTRLVMKVSSMGRAARSQAGIKVRQPLARLFVKAASGVQQRGLQDLSSQVMEEVNVKELVIVDKADERLEKGITEGDLTVALDTEITPELAAEGMARELVHRLQNMRRAAGFEIADHIISYYDGDEYTGRVMAQFADYIRQETLSEQLVGGLPEEGVFSEGFKLGGYEVKLGVRKLG